jgi:transcriptional regulator with XRE-family HTH domain
VPAAQGPMLARRRLRQALRKARETAGLTQEHVAGEMEWSLSKVIRIEAGIVGVTANDLKALFRLYNIAGETETNRLLELARAARIRSPRADTSAVAPAFVKFSQLEAEASAIWCFQSVAVPGLLQTEEYARIMVRGTTPQDPRPAEIEARVQARLARQRDVLARSEPLKLYVILDESVIRRVIGSPAVMRTQLAYLCKAAQQPGVTLRILPFSAGPHPIMTGASMILEFGEDDDPVLYVENAMVGEMVDRHDEMDTYYRAFENLDGMALDPDASIALMKTVVDEPT